MCLLRSLCWRLTTPTTVMSGQWKQHIHIYGNYSWLLKYDWLLIFKGHSSMKCVWPTLPDVTLFATLNILFSAVTTQTRLHSRQVMKYTLINKNSRMERPYRRFVNGTINLQALTFTRHFLLKVYQTAYQLHYYRYNDVKICTLI